MTILIKEAFGKVGDHISASSLNSWSGEFGDQGLWLLKRIYGLPFKGSPASIRGQAVEAAFDFIISERNGDYLKIAQDFYNLKIDETGDDLEKSEDTEKEYNDLGAYLDQGMRAKEELKIPKPFSSQGSIRMPLGGNLPDLYGFIDYRFEFKDERENYNIDLKATKRLPRKGIKSDHEEQISGYAKAKKDSIAKILYISPKDYEFYSMDQREINAAFIRQEFKAKNLFYVLESAIMLADIKGTDPKKELSKIIAPNFNAYGWNDKEMLLAKENNLFMFEKGTI